MSVKRFFIIVIHFCMLLDNAICNEENYIEIKKICLAIENHLDAARIYQIVLLHHKLRYSNSMKSIDPLLKCFLSRTTVISMETTFKIKSSSLSLFYNARQNSQFISILSPSTLQGAITNQFYNTLEFIINLSPNTTRPRCLFITSTREEISKNLKNEWLLHAWRKKFIDTTILEILPLKNLSIIEYYNPFTDVSTTEVISQKLEIFPNKLGNMYQYPLRVSVIHRPPSVNLERNTSGDVIAINGSDYGCIKYMSDKMNFSMRLMAPIVLGYDEQLLKYNNSRLLDLFEQDYIDVSGNQIFLYLYSFEGENQLGYQSVASYFDDLIIMVPVYPMPLWKLQFTTILVLVMIFVHVTVMYLSARLCGFNSRYWLPLRILQILFGISSPRVPSRMPERVFFLTLALISFQYSTVMYATVAGLRLTDRDEGPFNNLEDLKNSDLVIETRDVYANVLASSADDTLMEMLKKTKLVQGIMNCPTRAFQSRNIACLMDKSIALSSMEKYRNSPHKMKIMEYVFLRAPKGLLFSKASPFIPEFNRLMRRISEYGVWWRWYTPADKKSKCCKVSRTDIIFSKDPLLKNKLRVILISGCILSIVAFISEVIVDFFQQDGYTNTKKVNTRH